VGWAQDQGNFIADQVFPVVPVQKQSDLYAIYDKGYFYRDEVGERPLGDSPGRAGYKVEHGQYFTPELALAHTIDDRVRDNADQPLDPDLAAMRLLTTQMMIHRDRVWAEKYFSPTVWGTEWDGKNSGPGAGEFLQFDQAGSEPIQLFEQVRDEIAGSTGYTPNVLVLGAKVFRVLKNHPEIVDRVKYTQRDAVAADIIANLIGVEKIVLPRAVYNTAQEGATNSIEFLVNQKSALLVYAAPAPAIDQPTGGYTFTWTGLLPGATNAFGGVIERIRMEAQHSDEIQIRAAYDCNLVAKELGAYFEEVTA